MEQINGANLLAFCSLAQQAEDSAITTQNNMEALVKHYVALQTENVKLLAQCQCDAVSHVLTEDASTLTKYMERLSAEGHLETRCILLKAGFDAAWFENGQARLVP